MTCSYLTILTHKNFTWASTTTSRYVLISKQLQKCLLLYQLLHMYVANEHIIWETLNRYITSRRKWNCPYFIDISILRTRNTVLYRYMCTQYSYVQLRDIHSQYTYISHNVHVMIISVHLMILTSLISSHKIQTIHQHT